MEWPGTAGGLDAVHGVRGHRCAIALGRDHSDVWDVMGVSRPESAAEVGHADLYPDALDCVAAAHRWGRAVGIAGNQPAGAWGGTKPDQRFFWRLIDQAKLPAQSILYVGPITRSALTMACSSRAIAVITSPMPNAI
jgi:hypothetical protein